MMNDEFETALSKADTVVFDVGMVLFAFEEQTVCELIPPEHRQALRAAMFDPPKRWSAFDLGLEPNETIAKRIAQAAGFPGSENEVLHVVTGFHLVMHVLPLFSRLPELRQNGKKLYALTNYPEPSFTLLNEKHHVLDYLDGAIISAREHVAKPDPAIYQLLIDRYRITPEHSLYIDDLSENISAARAKGFQTWHYQPPAF